jgi:flagellar basal-body rod modification protein FlgD
MSIATTVAQQSALAAAAQAASKPVSASIGTPSTGPSGQNALTALSSNFGDFLNMLMTQLKNQDPSSPLDSNQFTQELVSFSGVEQQINTNNSLTQLIQLTQAGELMQGSSLAGKQVMVQSDQIPLQDGHGSVQFTASSAEPAAIAIADASGKLVRTAMLNAQAGVNTWNWDGKSDSGAVLPDGAYHISVYGTDAGGGTTALPFTVTGTVTDTHRTSGNGMQLQLGALDVGFGAVQSLKN